MREERAATDRRRAELEQQVVQLRAEAELLREQIRRRMEELKSAESARDSAYELAKKTSGELGEARADAAHVARRAGTALCRWAEASAGACCEWRGGAMRVLKLCTTRRELGKASADLAAQQQQTTALRRDLEGAAARAAKAEEEVHHWRGQAAAAKARTFLPCIPVCLSPDMPPLRRQELVDSLQRQLQRARHAFSRAMDPLQQLGSVLEDSLPAPPPAGPVQIQFGSRQQTGPGNLFLAAQSAGANGPGGHFQPPPNSH